MKNLSFSILTTGFLGQTTMTDVEKELMRNASLQINHIEKGFIKAIEALEPTLFTPPKPGVCYVVLIKKGLKHQATIDFWITPLGVHRMISIDQINFPLETSNCFPESETEFRLKFIKKLLKKCAK